MTEVQSQVSTLSIQHYQGKLAHPLKIGKTSKESTAERNFQFQLGIYFSNDFERCRKLVLLDLIWLQIHICAFFFTEKSEYFFKSWEGFEFARCRLLEKRQGIVDTSLLELSGGASVVNKKLNFTKKCISHSTNNSK